MLHIQAISKTYGIETILSDVTFVINRGERVGLVGPNGCGKTTLLRIIAGEETPDQGHIRFNPATLTIGYLRQALHFNDDDTIEQVLRQATADHGQAQAEMQRLADLMAQATEQQAFEVLADDYAKAEAQFEAAGSYALEIRLEAVLDGLGLADLARNEAVGHLSGGQKTRLGLAGLLIRQPQLLLLDEPTNHLDIDALDWLERWLAAYDGAVLIVSHDRTFLDATITRTLALDPVTHTVQDYPGNYSDYVETRDKAVAQQWQAYHDQQIEIAQLQNASRHLRGQAMMKKGGKADDGDKFAKGFFANKSVRSVGQAKQIERRIEQLLNEERIEKPKQTWGLKLDFAADNSGARRVLVLEDVGMTFDKRRLFAKVNAVLSHGQRVVLIGPNGGGKTTLLRVIMGKLAPTEGWVSLGQGIRLGYLAQEQETLNSDSTPFETIRREALNMDQSDIRTFLHFFLFAGDAVFTPIHNLSFGERTRLMLALLVVQGCNFLVLDEPINHLDIPSRERFEAALQQFPGTILAVVHDRTFVAHIATNVWELRDGRLTVHA